jgi:DNA-binding CsgD family transcriptional regulator
MNEVLDESLLAGDTAVCVKEFGKRFLMQNGRCIGVCGDHLGAIYELTCMEFYDRGLSQQWKDWRTRVYKNSYINAGFYDVTLLCSTDRIITFLQTLEEKYDMGLAHYRGKGLTRRETAVIALTIQGSSKSQICKRLSISKATLRAHRNKVYNKLRDAGQPLESIPPNRTPR